MSDAERTLGAHGAKIKSLEDRMGRMDEKLDEILATLNQAKGGWRLMMAVGGAAAAIGGVVATVLIKLFGK